MLKLKIQSSYFIQTINLFFPKSLLGSVTCKNCAKKSQNCRLIQNHDEGLKEGLKKQCVVEDYKTRLDTEDISKLSLIYLMQNYR